MGMLLKGKARQLVSGCLMHAAVSVCVVLPRGVHICFVLAGVAVHLRPGGNDVDLRRCNVSQGHLGAPLGQTPFPL